MNTLSYLAYYTKIAAVVGAESPRNIMDNLGTTAGAAGIGGLGLAAGAYGANNLYDRGIRLDKALNAANYTLDPDAVARESMSQLRNGGATSRETSRHLGNIRKEFLMAEEQAKSQMQNINRAGIRDFIGKKLVGVAPGVQDKLRAVGKGGLIAGGVGLGLYGLNKAVNHLSSKSASTVNEQPAAVAPLTPAADPPALRGYKVNPSLLGTGLAVGGGLTFGAHAAARGADVYNPLAAAADTAAKQHAANAANYNAANSKALEAASAQRMSAAEYSAAEQRLKEEAQRFRTSTNTLPRQKIISNTRGLFNAMDNAVDADDVAKITKTAPARVDDIKAHRTMYNRETAPHLSNLKETAQQTRAVKDSLAKANAVHAEAQAALNSAHDVRGASRTALRNATAAKNTAAKGTLTADFANTARQLGITSPKALRMLRNTAGIGTLGTLGYGLYDHYNRNAPVTQSAPTLVPQ